MTKKVVCMGNALVDIIVQLQEDKTLQELNLPKGSMQLVWAEESKKIQDIISHLPNVRATGGSAANTANGLANMGIDTAYIGKIGEDDLGKFYQNDMLQNNIKATFLKSQKTATGNALALISKDGERTFATYLGAAIELSAEEISEQMFQNYDIFHIEGYLISNQELVRKAIKCAKKQGLKISIDLASYNVVEENIEFLNEICTEVDIIFANEQEAEAFTNKKPLEAVKHIALMCDIAVVKIGKEGSLIRHKDQEYRIMPNEHKCLDTTGAGDMYAAGFLAALAKGMDLEKCGKVADVLAGNVIEVYGAKIDKERWVQIHKEIAQIK